MELEHLRSGKHTYAEYLLFGSTIVLCDFCRVDFDSYAPSYFGRRAVPRYSQQMQFSKDVEAETVWDKFCPSCERRLAFLRFLAHAKES